MAYTGDLPEAERDIIKLVSSDYCIYHIFKKYLLTYLLTYLLVSKAIKHLLIALSFSACAEINLFRNFASSSAFRDPAAICALFHRGILDVLVRQNLRRGQSLDGRFWYRLELLKDFGDATRNVFKRRWNDWIERSLLSSVASASDSPMRTIKFCSVVFGLYPSTDKNDVQAWCHTQDSQTLMLALRRPSA